jgi:hypothetical protein
MPQCPLCQTTCDSHRALKRHHKSHHQKSSDQGTVPPTKSTARESPIHNGEPATADQRPSAVRATTGRYHPYSKPGTPLSSGSSWKPSLSSVAAENGPSPTTGNSHPTPLLAEPLDGSKSYLESNDLFDHIGIRRHSQLRVLLCVCGKAVLSSHCYGHVKNHGITFTAAQSAELKEILATMDVVDTLKDFPHPQNGGPPVELLKQVQDGRCCNFCDYCVPSLKGIQNHWSLVHSKTLDVVFTDRHHCSTIQSIFTPVGDHYFEVNPSLAGLPSDDLFAIYMRDEVPKMPEFPATAPEDSRDVNPLLRSMQWHVHLANYTKDRRTRDAIRSLVVLPGNPAKTGIGSLGRVALDYLKDIRNKANSSSLSMRCLLMECPR